MFNFRDIAEEFLKNRAAEQVFNQEDLISNIKELLNNNLRAKELVKKCQRVLLNNQGLLKEHFIIRETNCLKLLIMVISSGYGY